MKQAKYNNKCVIRVTSEELDIILYGIQGLPQINKTINLFNKLNKVKSTNLNRT